MSNQEEKNLDTNQELVKLLKQQVFFSRLLSILFIMLIVMFLGAGIFALKYVKKVDKCLNQVNTLGTQVTDLMSALDVNKINAMFDKADTTFDQVDGILDTTNQAVEKVAILLENVQEVSDTVNEMEDKVHGMLGF